MEIEFLVTRNKIYFLEINPRVCGHLSQLDKNYNSIYFNEIIVPYIKFYGYNVPKHHITYQTFSGTNPITTFIILFSTYKYTISILLIIYICILIGLLYNYPKILTFVKNLMFGRVI